MVSNKRFGPRAVVDIKSPPKHIQGRAGALRIRRGELDLTFIVADIPPRSGLAANHSQWVKTVNETLKWIHRTLQATPTRSAPLIGIDLNDHYGADGLIAAEVTVSYTHLTLPTILLV
eukprot:3230851-Pyramimonas_sp.AAC.1